MDTKQKCTYRPILDKNVIIINTFKNGCNLDEFGKNIINLCDVLFKNG